jgi:hypothetical protein
MPLYDTRTIDTTRKGKLPTAGRRMVSYRDALGRTRDAVVLSQGTGSGLKLRLANQGAAGGRIIDNVPKAATKVSTGAYFARNQ